ncbi:MAG: CPBP family intramembrane glutamic endopeptidase [Candidatus Roizmanbacteria bacterium]
MKTQVTATQRALNLWAIVLIVWALYRSYFKTDLPVWFDEFVAKPVVFVLPIYWYITYLEKKSFFSEIWLLRKNFSNNVFIGLGVGAVFIFSGALGNYILTKSIFPANNLATEAIMMVILTALATGITEEILSRGFVLKKLYQESKNIYSSIFLSSVLFFFLHVPILFTSHMFGASLLRVMLADVVLSVTVSIFYLDRKSIVIPILIHALYNISLMLYM